MLASLVLLAVEMGMGHSREQHFHNASLCLEPGISHLVKSSQNSDVQAPALEIYFHSVSQGQSLGSCFARGQCTSMFLAY